MNDTNRNYFDEMTVVNEEIMTATATHDSTPLVKLRHQLAGPTERLASEETVENHRETLVANLNHGPRIHAAGMSFLEQIHAEVRESLPQWKKDQNERETEELQRQNEKEAAMALNSMEAEEGDEKE